MQVLEGEMCFHDAGGLHSGPQHILLCGDVIRFGYPLQVIQVAGGSRQAGLCCLIPSLREQAKGCCAQVSKNAQMRHICVTNDSFKVLPPKEIINTSPLSAIFLAILVLNFLGQLLHSDDV